MNLAKTPHLRELRALLLAEHGRVERIARMADMDPKRLSNCINPEQSHTLTMDESWAVIGACCTDGIPGAFSLLDHMVKQATKNAPSIPTNGSWADEAAPACREMASLLERFGNTPMVSDMSPSAITEALAGCLRTQDLLAGLRMELARRAAK